MAIVKIEYGEKICLCVHRSKKTRSNWEKKHVIGTVTAIRVIAVNDATNDDMQLNEVNLSDR